MTNLGHDSNTRLRIRNGSEIESPKKHRWDKKSVGSVQISLMFTTFKQNTNYKLNIENKIKYFINRIDIYNK